jgi:hypothetical protein
MFASADKFFVRKCRKKISRGVTVVGGESKWYDLVNMSYSSGDRHHRMVKKICILFSEEDPGIRRP